MKRRLFTFISLVAAMVCLALSGAWIDSHRHFSAIGVAAKELAGAADTSNGIINVVLERNIHGSLFGDTSDRIAAAVIHDKNDESEYEFLASWVGFHERLGGRHEAMLDGPLHTWHGLGFSYAPGFDTGLRSVRPGGEIEPDYYTCSICFPFWLLVAISAVLPVRWIAIRHGFRVRRPERACNQCGYDLRASPERCPECGTAISNFAE